MKPSAVLRLECSQAEDWLFESQPRQTLFVKTGSDGFTAYRSTISESGTGPWR